MDIKLKCDLIIYCTRKAPKEYYECKSALLNDCEIEDMLTHSQRNGLRDLWCMTDTTGEKERDYVLTFDVEFSGPDEIDDVFLNGESIIDLVGPVMDAELIEEAKADHKDRGINRRGA